MELFEQAEKIYQLVKQNIDEKEIARELNVSINRIRRAFRAISLIEEYKNSDYGEQFKPSTFELFNIISANPVLKNWLEWRQNEEKPQNLINLERLFSWISETDLLGTAKDSSPILKTGDDVRSLSYIIDDEEKLRLLDNKEKSLSEIINSSNKDKKIKYISDSIKGIIEDLKPYITSGDRVLFMDELSDLHEVTTECIDNGINSHLAYKNTSYSKIKKLELFDLEIIKYNRINNLHLRKLNIINLIAGKNNAGKTSTLEAIYLLLKQNNVNGLYEITSKRAKITESIPVKWLASMLNRKIQVKGNNGLYLDIIIEEEKSSEINLDGYQGSIFLKSGFQEKEYNSKTVLNSIYGNKTSAKEINELIPVVYTSPFISSSIREVSLAYNSTIEKKGLYHKIIQFLQKVDPGIVDIKLSDENEIRRFLVEHQDYEEPFDISQFGEGLQRIFNISLQFASATNGVLLIDEVENAIHYSLFKNFASFIYQLAVEFNVQVFISSHSKEAIDAFVIDDYLQYLSVYHLQEINNGISAKYASGEEFKKLVNSLDMDLRGEE